LDYGKEGDINMDDYKITAPPGMPMVLITQTIHAPRELVFKTITDPLQIPKWWGPERFKTRVINMAVMPGGTWRFLQLDEQGKEYGFHGVYHNVRIPEHLVYTSEFEGVPDHVTLYSEDLTEQDGMTIITTKILFPSVEDRDQMIQWGMEEGTSAMTNRLNDLLASSGIPERKDISMEKHEERNGCISISRIFEAPLEKVWEQWTEPMQYKCWWGPKEFTSPFASLEVRKGGKFLVSMQAPDGKQYWDTGTYEEVVKNQRLVYTDTFADEKGNVVPASYYGMGPDQPLDMAVEINFEDVGGKTRMSLEHCGLPEGDMLDNARTGWNQSFDKLASCLE
jgi:uncharacterized protein YndB with AHSA1/START domain